MSKKGKIDLLTDEEFKKLIESHKSIRSVLTELGYKNASGAMHKKLRERIEQIDISVDHMVSRFGSSNGKTIPLNEILVQNSQYQNIGRLKIRLINENKMCYICVKCENNGDWMGSPITLQLDHINGVRDDHRIENLRFLCPNCHSQTETYTGRNKK